MKFIKPSLFLFVLFFVFLYSASALPAQAHSTVYDGAVGALLHINPDDDPVAREPAQLYFHIESEEEIDLKNCNCRILIERGNKVLADQSLGDADQSFGSDVKFFEFTFPKKGLYKITLTGNAMSQAEPFSLVYNVRVERESTQVLGPITKITNFLFGPAGWIIFAVLIITAVVIILRDRRKKALYSISSN